MTAALNVETTPEWRQILRGNCRNWRDLALFLELSLEDQETILAHSSFPLNLPWHLVKKMEKGTLDDPLLKQFLPVQEELRTVPGYSTDPVGETQARKEKKLLQKYQGRALLLCSSACAMHCRYCFRRAFPYESREKSFEKELALIREDSSIQELIFSGGDPLSLSDTRLAQLFQEIAAIPHVTRVRIHSRFPIGIPERIDLSFLQLVDRFSERFALYFVAHINHPKELGSKLFSRMRQLRKRGVVLLNQSVLLAGINDSIDTLATLCRSLADQGIIPYYLHQFDPTQGAHHFVVSEERGRELVAQLAERLSGYAVPRYVKEIAGEPAKTPLM